VEALNGARQKGDWSTSEQLALNCHKLDPFNETAIIARAEASAMRGNKKEAVAILDRYLEEMGSKDKYLTLSAVILRKRITEKIPERSVQECAFVGRSLEIEKLTFRLTAARAGNGGRGLGLAIAREIVQAHGGRIDLQSAPQTGTRFTVSIPALEASPSSTLISSEPTRPAEVATARR